MIRSTLLLTAVALMAGPQDVAKVGTAVSAKRQGEPVEASPAQVETTLDMYIVIEPEELEATLGGMVTFSDQPVMHGPMGVEIYQRFYARAPIHGPVQPKHVIPRSQWGAEYEAWYAEHME